MKKKGVRSWLFTVLLGRFRRYDEPDDELEDRDEMEARLGNFGAIYGENAPPVVDLKKEEEVEIYEEEYDQKDAWDNKEGRN